MKRGKVEYKIVYTPVSVFPCKGALPQSLQSVNTKIWSEWLPSCKDYKLAGNYNIEMYCIPPANSNDTYTEIWVPVTKP